MSLAVCLLFDPRSERLLRELWARLEDEGVATLATHTHGRHLPHLSLAVLRSWEPHDIERLLGAGVAPGPERMACRGTLIFPRGRVALAPAVGATLMAQQDGLVRTLQEWRADLHKHYRPGEWVPHISIATRAAAGQLPLVVKALTDVLPLEIEADRAALIDSSTGRSWAFPS
ncbi:2'-5' RNA ligase family protein [Nocardioides insulae]|uniref:2'-5' RNA ligase family protein n=1 Tax=Nocardioides insulae TaxID=394734 RepID=UPI0004130528|nr:2'-5' RNA ligase family protein [Nocardioides insulae]